MTFVFGETDVNGASGVPRSPRYDNSDDKKV
jgi:hypothetical protein